MRNILVVTTAGLTAAALGLAIVGCGSTTETGPSDADATSVNAPLDPTDGDPDTLHEYILDRDIAETPFNPGDPGTPNYDLPFPDGWSLVPEVPDWVFGAIVYDAAAVPDDPPTVTAIGSKLTGDVEVAEILDYASGLLDGMPEFEPLGDADESPVSGFDSTLYSGTYTHDGERRFIAEKVIVVPAPDGFFVLQLDGTSIESDSQIVLDAMEWIREHTIITA